MPAFEVVERSYLQSSINTSCKLFTQLPAILHTRVPHAYQIHHLATGGHACLSEEDHSSKDIMF